MSSTEQTASRTRAIMALIVVNAMWGTSFPLMKTINLEVYQHFGVNDSDASNLLRVGAAAWMLAIRFAASLALFTCIFWSQVRRLSRAQILSGVFIGTLFGMGILLQVIGLGTIPASRSGFLTSMAVVFTPIVNTIYQRKYPRVVVLAGALLAILGISILTGLVVWNDSGIAIADNAISKWTLGDTLTLIGAFFFSIQIMSVDILGKKYDSLGFTPSMFATTALIAILVFGLVSPQISATSEHGWIAMTMEPRFFLLISLLVIFPSLLAFAWMNKYQPFISAEQAAVIYTTEPVFASGWAMFLPFYLSTWCGISYANEKFTLPMLLGGAFIMFANVLALWPERKPETPSDDLSSDADQASNTT